MSLKKVVIYIVLLTSLPLQGQLSLRNDTILIKEVFINGSTVQQSDACYKTIRLDSAALINYSIRTLADLISENTSIFIKTYGLGGIATPSFRGTGASHTQIAWNSINLNNPMIGQFDLSLIPAGFIDDVKIYYGGGSMSVNSSGIGGMINMETKPEWIGTKHPFYKPGIWQLWQIFRYGQSKSSDRPFSGSYQSVY